MEAYEASRNRCAPAAQQTFAATIRAPFATLGIRTNAQAIIELEYLPDGTPEQTPRGPLTIKRWLLAHEGYRFGA